MKTLDENYMLQALTLAELGRFTTHPNPRVGCIIVNQGVVVGEGFHQYRGGPHAEVVALNMAGEAAQGATVYVTLEPCSHYGTTPPCVEALLQAKVARVVVAMQDPNPLVAGQGIARLRAAGIAVVVGVLAQQAEQINLGFLKRMRTGMPYVQLKLAASLDGRTAMASGESKWITSQAARQDVQQWRAQSGAILSTSATVLRDDPALTVRWDELPETIQTIYSKNTLRSVPRLILDSQRSVTSDYQIMQMVPNETILIRPSTAHNPFSIQQHQFNEWFIPSETPSQINLTQLLRYAAQQEINHIWVEAGAKLAGSLLQQGLVDELILYLAPKLLGEQALPLCYLPGLSQLHKAPQFNLMELTAIGSDIRLRLQPTY